MATFVSINDVAQATPQVSQFVQEWTWIPAEKLSDIKQKKLAYQLNCLGSLYYFIVLGLERRRLTKNLHYKLCRTIEKDHIKDVIEIPRDHFKTTIFGEGAPMWWALPFTDEHEYAMRGLGYGNEYIRWMRKTHNIDTRTLIVSEVIDNAIKIGARIQHHYLNGQWFRWLFPEILPDSSCVWNAKSMTHKRTGKSPNGEGTFDFLGVGSALQSRHYERVIEDDIFGRDAANSEKIANDSWDYHRKLIGAFDSDPLIAHRLNDEIIVGNRWSIYDLNYRIRKEEAELNYNFQTHDAEGGCCPDHPAGQPIFPEEWTPERLKAAKIKLGVFDYSCQYRNNPIPEGQTEFDEKWLRFYDYGPASPTDPRVKVIHQVYNGQVINDLFPANLQIELISDPAHADRASSKEDSLRCRHAIVVIGYQANPQRIYILDCWAKACRYHEYVAKIYELVKKWKLRRIWLETVAAQKYLKMYLEYRNTIENLNLKIEELKTDNSPNAKFKRIRAMNTFYEECQVWVRQANDEFIDEYKIFPYGKTIDVLDVVGYAPQTFRVGTPSRRELVAAIQERQAHFENSRNPRTGY